MTNFNENQFIEKRKNLEEVIDFLQIFGIPQNTKGFEYLKVAICMVVDGIDIWNVKKLYLEIEKQYGITYTSLEQAIRDSIRCALKLMDESIVKYYFGDLVVSGQKNVTNLEFIYLIADEFQNKKNNKLEQDVTRSMHKLGFTRDLRGFYYIRSIILKVIESNGNIKLKDDIYKEILNQYGITKNMLFKAINNSIKCTLNHMNKNTKKDLFGEAVVSGQRKVTRAEIIYHIADEVRFNQINEKNNKLEKDVTECMYQLGLIRKSIGFYYIRDIILKVIESECNDKLEQYIYPMIAEKYKIISKSLEQAIKESIEYALNQMNKDTMKECFGDLVAHGQKKVTKLDFINCIVNKIRCKKS